MPNLDFPRGFVPVRTQGNYNIEYFPTASNNPRIFKYDPVERRADGFFYPAQAGSLTIVGSAEAEILANTGQPVPVNPDPNLRFHAQASGAEIDAQTDFDLNYNILATSGNTLTGRSQMEIDSSTGAATATLPIKILRIAPSNTPAGNALGANVLLELIFNNHLFKSTGVNG